MHKSLIALTGLMLATAATPAFAQDEESAPVTISGSATVVSDYRFRGFTQSNEDFAVQAGLTATHESGFYVGTWGSSIGFGGGTEIDLFGGFATEVSPGVTLDIGATYYTYPNATGNTDVAEAYTAVSGELGPVKAKLGLAYAPDGQDALGDDSAVYAWTDLSTGIPNTPLTAKAHLGYAKSDSFLGGPDGDALDYSVGVDASYNALTFGVSYVNTDVKKSLGKEGLGADGRVVFSLGAAF